MRRFEKWGGNYHKLSYMLIDRPYVQVKWHLHDVLFIGSLRGLGIRKYLWLPCVYRIGCSSDDLGEDDPIGWFELEEEWDEAEIKLQQCRVARVSIIELVVFVYGPPPLLLFCKYLSSGYCVSAMCQQWNPWGESWLYDLQGIYSLVEGTDVCDTVIWADIQGALAVQRKNILPSLEFTKESFPGKVVWC